jgi:hypothetical protein
MWKMTILLLSMLVGNAMGQPGNIGVFRDPAGLHCQLVTPESGTVTFFLVHLTQGTVSGSQFSAPKPDCLNATYISTTCAFPGCGGDAQTGLSIDYGSCLTGAIVAATVTYVVNGLTDDCCFYNVLPHADAESGKIEIMDCDGQVGFGGGGTGIINAKPWCLCELVPVQETTWGGVKAIYDTQ